MTTLEKPIAYYLIERGGGDYQFFTPVTIYTDPRYAHMRDGGRTFEWSPVNTPEQAAESMRTKYGFVPKFLGFDTMRNGITTRVMERPTPLGR
jgi:hypothetical protein